MRSIIYQDRLGTGMKNKLDKRRVPLCFGKKIVFIYKWLKKDRFGKNRMCTASTSTSGKETPFFAPFIYKMHHFTKTCSTNIGKT